MYTRFARGLPLLPVGRDTAVRALHLLVGICATASAAAGSTPAQRLEWSPYALAIARGTAAQIVPKVQHPDRIRTIAHDDRAQLEARGSARLVFEWSLPRKADASKTPDEWDPVLQRPGEDISEWWERIMGCAPVGFGVSMPTVDIALRIDADELRRGTKAVTMANTFPGTHVVNGSLLFPVACVAPGIGTPLAQRAVTEAGLAERELQALNWGPAQLVEIVPPTRAHITMAQQTVDPLRAEFQTRSWMRNSASTIDGAVDHHHAARPGALKPILKLALIDMHHIWNTSGGGHKSAWLELCRRLPSLGFEISYLFVGVEHPATGAFPLDDPFVKYLNRTACSVIFLRRLVPTSLIQELGGIEAALLAAPQVFSSATTWDDVPSVWAAATSGLYRALAGVHVMATWNRPTVRENMDSWVFSVAKLAGVKVRIAEMPILDVPSDGATALQAPSQFVCESPEAVRYGLACHVVPPIVDTARFVDAARSIAPHALASRRYRSVIMVGRLDPDSSPGMFIRAAAIVSNEMPKVRFWVVGSGDLHPHLKQLAARLGVDSRISFVGHSAALLPRLVAAADLMVVPSSFPVTFGMACLEAQAAGTPVVGFLRGAARESTGVAAGAAVQVLNVSAQALADEVVALLRDPRRLETLRNTGAEWAAQFAPQKRCGAPQFSPACFGRRRLTPLLVSDSALAARRAGMRSVDHIAAFYREVVDGEYENGPNP